MAMAKRSINTFTIKNFAFVAAWREIFGLDKIIPEQSQLSEGNYHEVFRPWYILSGAAHWDNYRQ